MGGFSNVLGSVAGGFEQARQADLQRSFADEQNRRSFMGDALQKLAFDPNQHPDVRNAALQSYIQLGQTPWNKAVDVKKMFDPIVQAHTTAVAQPPTQTSVTPPQRVPGAASQLPSIQAPPLPPGMSGPTQQMSPAISAQAQGGSTLPQQAQFTPPPSPPPSLLASAPEIAANQGMTAGAVAGGQLTGQLGARATAFQEMMHNHPELANDPMVQQMAPFMLMGTPVPFGLTRPFSGGTDTAANMRAAGYPVPANIPDNQWVRAEQSGLGGMQFTPTAPPAGFVTKTTTGTSKTPGGLTSTHSQTVTPNYGGGGTSSTPPAKNSSRGGSSSKRTGSGTPPEPPAVAAAMDNMMLYGMPEGKMNDAQALAEQHMKALGIDPSIAATNATKSMADKGRAILPLIEKARQLISANPTALGPLAGRWSELQNRAGSLTGPAKELAGTLVSIYSMAGGMHGWRAASVPEQFAKTYGDLSNDPASLNAGLNALTDTANTLIKTAYPGMPNAPSTTTPPKQFKWEDHPVIQ